MDIDPINKELIESVAMGLVGQIKQFSLPAFYQVLPNDEYENLWDMRAEVIETKSQLHLWPPSPHNED